MGEKLPDNNEKEPIKMFDDCNTCDKRYELTKDNTEAYVFVKQPECSYLMCTCVHCNAKMVLFVGNETVDNVGLTDIHISVKEYADDKIYRRWLKAYGIELVQEKELTDRHEKIIAGFGSVIENI